MSEEYVNHKDASRILRQAAKEYETKQNKRRAFFFRQQAQVHDHLAEVAEDTEHLNNEIFDLVLLMAKELTLSGAEVGYFTDVNPWVAHVLIRHTFLGVLRWSMPAQRIPTWLQEVEPIDVSGDNETTDKIHRYLRPLNDPALT